MSKTRNKHGSTPKHSPEDYPVDIALQIARESADSSAVRREIRRAQQLRIVERAFSDDVEEAGSR